MATIELIPSLWKYIVRVTYINHLDFEPTYDHAPGVGGSRPCFSEAPRSPEHESVRYTTGHWEVSP